MSPWKSSETGSLASAVLLEAEAGASGSEVLQLVSAVIRAKEVSASRVGAAFMRNHESRCRSGGKSDAWAKMFLALLKVFGIFAK